MYKYIILIWSLLMTVHSICSAQEETIISIQEAIAIALENDPSLRANALMRFQNEKLSKGTLVKPPTQISISGDEFNFESNNGIQSLNFQQNFNHPKLAKSYNEFYEVKASKVEQLSVINKKEIVQHVQAAYYRLVFAKQYVKLTQDLQSVYQDFYSMANAAFESGETNKLPVVSANTLEKKGGLLMNHAIHEVEEAKEILSIWLGGNKMYNSIEEDLNVYGIPSISIEDDNPHLNIFQIEKAMALKNIEIQESKMLPQFVTGLRLQSVNGDLLFFGYQAGLNIPLFRKANNNRIEAAKVDIEIQEERLNGKRKTMLLEVSRISNHIEHLVSKINYFDAELLPAAEEEKNLLKEAYQAGETSYLQYMMALESYKNFQLERLELLKDYFMSLTDLNYWTTIN